jgi:hypothetical protein
LLPPCLRLARQIHALGHRRFRFALPAGGSKTFVFCHRPHGGGSSVNPRVAKLGSFSSVSVDDARAARIHAGDVAKGKDPALERAEERHGTTAPRQGDENRPIAAALGLAAPKASNQAF